MSGVTEDEAVTNSGELVLALGFWLVATDKASNRHYQRSPRRRCESLLSKDKFLFLTAGRRPMHWSRSPLAERVAKPIVAKKDDSSFPRWRLVVIA